MEKLILEISQVQRCDARSCSYNVDGSCHAKAITIGDGAVPACDTYLDLGIHCRTSSRTAGVGACKVSRCRFNDDLECTKTYISIGPSHERVECLDFSMD